MIGKVLSPSRPLQSEEFLRGRAEQLSGIKKALYQPGRHVLIHGFRGVGKSSLAQTAAYALSIGTDPILVGCEAKSILTTVIDDVINEAVNKNPTIEKKVKEAGASFSSFGFGGSIKTTTHVSAVTEPGSVNEAVRLTQYLCGHTQSKPVIVVDEFDQIRGEIEQEAFTNFLKQISDKHVPARFMWCRRQRRRNYGRSWKCR